MFLVIMILLQESTHHLRHNQQLYRDPSPQKLTGTAVDGCVEAAPKGTSGVGVKIPEGPSSSAIWVYVEGTCS